MASDPSSSGNGDGTNQPEGKRMTPEQHALVHDSYAKIVPIAPEFAGWFYDRLFEIDPATKPLFMGDMAAQGHKLMATLGAVVEAIDHLETIVPAVRKLGLQHKEYGVQPAQYDSVASALLWTLQRALGDDFTPAAKCAWTDAYNILATTMKEAAA
jgi:hemoglobin-like flavoprotein